jgi:hypothetical protein
VITAVGNVMRFPGQEGPESGSTRYVSVALAGMSAAVGLVSALIFCGVVFGSAESDIRNLSSVFQLDHTETKRAIDALTTNVNSLAMHDSALTSQVDALRTSLEQERSDRLDMERRFWSK